ncbi:hypothetical protein HLH34_04255 [Gluconacetobacter azotocaptans]|uniref:Uncharacterized protein n=1 Tax=Gluconacetobacter azotocaptans TaxID=142834 RepID=A0A7W4JQR4_9PROT|nr:hypothetical protein [Gluconacetobacter azotocaptans]MBB2189176.1 hypothetical protein [Gluconacetobacter azotocaptans]GBQ32153.1 hypothetical protein AA13594_2285 [Gluconacetobacter azotocaptans DSM 13594]
MTGGIDITPLSRSVDGILADPPVDPSRLLYLSDTLDRLASELDQERSLRAAADARHQAVRLRAAAMRLEARRSGTQPAQIIEFPNSAASGTGEPTP